MSNQVVVIRTFSTELEASIAKAELDNAGIHSLLMTSNPSVDVSGHPNLQLSHGVGLAVLERDADTAAAILEARDVE